MADRVTAFAPGRVNLIGEHTDYNEGLALPFAISEGVTVRAQAIAGDRVEAVAADLNKRDAFKFARPPQTRGWRAFVRGTVAELQRAGVPVRAAHVEITGNVPRGGGLSSSAALEVALTLALIALAGAPEPDRIELAKLCSKIENDWVGAQTGLLDQLASLLGEDDHALRIDFRSLEITPVTLELGEFKLVTLHSGDHHSNAASGYNERRRECALASEELGVPSLRDATLEAAAALPPPLNRRATHIITENQRVDATVAALERRDMDELGRLLDASHASLRDCYEVSTPAVERAVEKLREAGALGARIIGGGFGGHVLGLMPPGARVPEGARGVRPGPGARVMG
jgi:galactokinase